MWQLLENNVTSCPPETTNSTVQLLDACSQVVAGIPLCLLPHQLYLSTNFKRVCPSAGTNYKVLFNVAFGCEVNGVAVTDEVTLNASAFVPLPIGGNSATPQVLL